MTALKALLPLAIATACSTSITTHANEDSVTIYSSLQPGAVSADLYRPAGGHQRNFQIPGYAIVRHDRSLDIKRGIAPLRITDVAGLIDPTTVTFTSLDNPSTRVLEQSFQYDLVSQSKLLQRYIGEKVLVEQPIGQTIREIEGTLLGVTDGLTLQLEDGSVQAMRSYGNIRFPDLPGGLITKPTLEWLLDSPDSGAQQARIAYETKGMTWWADYNIIYREGKDSNACNLDLSAWVSIINQSGASFEQARLKLIAGDINRSPAAQAAPVRRKMVANMAMMEADSVGFEEKSFFEYHLYTLQQRTDLPDRSTKQIELIPTARNIQCEKELVFAPTMDFSHYGGHQFNQDYGTYGNSDVNVYLRFANKKEQQLGIPMPAGRIRVNQLDEADGSLEFIGEDVIDHTPRNEQVLIRMGNAFDVVGERKQTDFKVDTVSRQLWETFEIKLRNQKDSEVDIVVLENLYRMANWSIEGHSNDFSKENSNRIRFDVTVPAEKELTLSYTVHYRW